MSENKMKYFRLKADEITFEVIPYDGRIETAQEIVEKIREANKEGCTLRVEIKNVSR